MATAQKRQKQASKRDYYKILAAPKMAWLPHRKGKNRPVKEITTKSWVYAEMLAKRKSAKLTGSWLNNGIRITSKTKMKRKKPKRNSWTLLLPKKFCPMMKCDRNLTVVKIL